MTSQAHSTASAIPFTTDCEQQVLPFFEGQTPLVPVDLEPKN